MRHMKAFRYKLMPKGSHIHKMRQFCGRVLFFFNKTLAYQKKLYEADKASKFSYTKLANFLST